MRRVRGRRAFQNLIPTAAFATADGTETTVAKASEAQERDSDNNLCIQHYQIDLPVLNVKLLQEICSVMVWH